MVNSFLCGAENGAECTGGTVVTGAAAGDLSGFTLTFEGMEETAPYFLASTGNWRCSTIDPTAIINIYFKLEASLIGCFFFVFTNYYFLYVI